MSFKILRIFVTVYREGSITNAAKKLNLSQPAVSAALKELESRYEVQLFVRAGRGIRKTPAADLLYEYASHISALYTEMEHTFSGKGELLPLRIGASISVGACLMPECIRAYIETGNHPIPRVTIDNSDAIEQMIIENELDFAVIEGNIHSTQLYSEPLADDRLLVICSPLHPLTQKKEVILADLYEEDFLMREKKSGTRQLAESVLALHDFILHPVWESTSTRAIINAVALDLGISILPARMCRRQLSEGLIKELPIRGIRFTRSYSLIYHRNKYLNDSLINALDFFKNYVRSHTVS